jgi:hypothetical protein
MKKIIVLLIFLLITASNCKEKKNLDLVSGGVITFSIGNVLISSPIGEKKPEIGMIVSRGETIITKEKSYIDIQLPGGSIIRVKEKTKVLLEELVLSNGKVKVGMNIDRGKVFAKIPGKILKESDFVIRTPTLVAGVRGTEFSVESDELSSNTKVLDGQVEVNKNDSNDTVEIDSGKKIEIDPSTPPVINDLTEQEKAELKSDSDTVATMTDDVKSKAEDNIKNFEEFKKSLDDSLKEQKQKNQDALDDVKNKSNSELDSLKAKNQQELDARKTADKELLENTKAGTKEKKDEIKNKASSDKENIDSTKSELEKFKMKK